MRRLQKGSSGWKDGKEERNRTQQASGKAPSPQPACVEDFGEGVEKEKRSLHSLKHSSSLSNCSAEIQSIESKQPFEGERGYEHQQR